MKVTAAALLVGLTVAAPAGATTVRLYAEEEMVRTAHAIVRGHVLSVTPRWDNSGLIVTDVTVAVERNLKNAAGPKVVFTQLGGKVGERELHVAGTSTYTPGEEVLVFLERGGGGLVEMGVGAGKWHIERKDGVPMVERQLAHLAFANVAGGRTQLVAPPTSSGPEPLAAFEGRITQVLAKVHP